MNYTDTQLKQALAKMLPERYKWDEIAGVIYYEYDLVEMPVLDTELLHLCQEARNKLTLISALSANATWQQQVEELIGWCKQIAQSPCAK
jgi:hypothetical protein